MIPSIGLWLAGMALAAAAPQEPAPFAGWQRDLESARESAAQLDRPLLLTFRCEP